MSEELSVTERESILVSSFSTSLSPILQQLVLSFDANLRGCNKRCEENGVTGVVKGMLSYCDTFLRSPGSKVMVRMM